MSTGAPIRKPRAGILGFCTSRDHLSGVVCTKRVKPRRGGHDGPHKNGFREWIVGRGGR